MVYKYCYLCKEAKESILFSKSSSTKDGLNSACKLCEKIRHAKYLDSLTSEEKQLRSKNYMQWKRRRKRLNRRYEKKRRQENIIFRITGNLRSRLNKIIRGKVKSGSAIRDLGCTGAELKSHLESLWEPWMSWDNYGIKPGFWSIDHIIPLSSVDLSDRDEFLKINHYTNLRPLLHELNIKKSDKLI